MWMLWVACAGNGGPPASPPQRAAADTPPAPTAPDGNAPPVTTEPACTFWPDPPPPVVRECPEPCREAPGAPPCGEPPVFVWHHSELTVRRRVAAVRPANTDDVESARCIVTVQFDERGEPRKASSSGCPAAFAAAAETAVLAWRWRPPLNCTRPVWSETKVALLFPRQG